MNSSFFDAVGTIGNRQANLLARVGYRRRRWHELGRQRRQLANLDERTLRDIGISHIEARQEARRWVWDDPQT